MPKPEHTLVTWSGVFGGVTAPIERWSVSLAALGGQVSAATPVWTTIADAMHLAFRETLGVLYGPSIALTGTRAVRVDALGKYKTRIDGTYELGDSALVTGFTAGGTAGALMPLQTALVVSLATGRPGPTGKGRIFLPWPTIYGLQPDFRLSAGNAASLSLAARDFVARVNRAFSGLPAIGAESPAVRTQVVSSKGYGTTVTGVRVGRAPDTMRSRRSSLVEAYADTPIPA